MSNGQNSHGNKDLREKLLIEFDEKDITLIIDDGDYDHLVKKADKWAEGLKEKLSTSQIRNIFGEVKQIQLRGFEKNKNRFKLLKPKLAYASHRSGSNCPKEFSNLLEDAISAVGDNEVKFERFVDLFESLLAYHKAWGGK